MRIRIGVDATVDKLLRQPYARLLAVMIRWRWQMFAFGIALFLLTLGSIFGGFARVIFFPSIDADDIQAEYLLEPGAPEAVNKAVARRIEAALITLRAELKEESGKELILNHLTYSEQYTFQEECCGDQGAYIMDA